MNLNKKQVNLQLIKTMMQTNCLFMIFFVILVKQEISDSLKYPLHIINHQLEGVSDSKTQEIDAFLIRRYLLIKKQVVFQLEKLGVTKLIKN
jgi:hypothetical protein